MIDKTGQQSQTNLDPQRLSKLEKEIAKLFSKYKTEEIGYCLVKYQIKLANKPPESEELTHMASGLKDVS